MLPVTSALSLRNASMTNHDDDFDCECDSQVDLNDEIDESMDGDHESALESVFGPSDDFQGGEDSWLDGSYEGE